MIILKRESTARVESSREVFTPDARRQLKHEVNWRKKVLDGQDQKSHEGTGTFRVRDRLQDPGEMRKEMKQYEKDLERGTPVKLSSESRNALWKKAKRLKDEFRVGMLSQDEMHPVKHREIVENGVIKTAVVVDKDKMSENKSVERNVAWCKKNDDKVREFKNIMRTLEPDHPNVTDVERFRPKKKQGGIK